MRPFIGGMMMGRADPLEFRSAAHTTSFATCTKPAGVEVGDLVIVAVSDGMAPGGTLKSGVGGVAWPVDYQFVAAHSYQAAVFIKVLDAVDLASAWVFSGAVDAQAWAFPTEGEVGGAYVRSAAVNGLNQATLSLAGFTPTNTFAAIAVIIDRDADVTPAPPADFTTLNVHHAIWTFAVAITDSYAGAAAVWSGLDAGVDDFAEVGWLIEVTGA